jgi:hypothetical protein
MKEKRNAELEKAASYKRQRKTVLANDPKKKQ